MINKPGKGKHKNRKDKLDKRAKNEDENGRIFLLNLENLRQINLVTWNGCGVDNTWHGHCIPHKNARSRKQEKSMRNKKNQWQPERPL